MFRPETDIGFFLQFQMTCVHLMDAHYLAFLDYPDAIRRSLSTTNTVEAVNGQLERLRRNSGGYFQSDDT